VALDALVRAVCALDEIIVEINSAAMGKGVDIVAYFEDAVGATRSAAWVDDIATSALIAAATASPGTLLAPGEKNDVDGVSRLSLLILLTLMPLLILLAL
jgi:hypothetical protein